MEPAKITGVGPEIPDSASGANTITPLENRSICILREAVHHFDKMAMLWSAGKESNVILRLARKAFFGQAPFPLVHLDTSYEIPELTAFRYRLVAERVSPRVVARNDQPPELWAQFNTDFQPDAHLRVHPLPQWTEANTWEQIEREGIPVPDLDIDRCAVACTTMNQRTRSRNRVATVSCKQCLAGHSLAYPDPNQTQTYSLFRRIHGK